MQADPRAAEDVRRLARAEYLALQAKLAGIDAEIARRQAELRTTQALARKLERTSPIARQRASR